MEDYEAILNAIMAHLNPNDIPKTDTIPVGISNRHIHLSQSAVNKLFGSNYQLTKLKDLSQPGQYACKECVTICGPKGVIEKVRILGPVRSETQVEILQSDTFKLGVKGTLRLSGDLANTPGITLIGPEGSYEISQGVIVAKRHIHMLPQDAERFEVSDGQMVTIDFAGDRGGSLNNVVIRATANSGLECHIDTEEANALGVTPGTTIKIRK
ncbi:phosphate propanoyltransferase [Enterococcus hulanensis]|uniref:Phosphate propanoyltransferase n=1 Tax=Enterococcus hulanensis TaxID=2559929 RepID=A0ABU3EXI7_9ENTE|nr:phosphate propanoyltransferase [Enterococcus hulanensis]MDT2599592.1 phosphate propanoyltransferase [Enterococcus hulanensis]MDT2609552.1 phosphate propanoyltransferase [Enterococcus hulanensis]MDT2616129.1 phosphate propanoyltransferase [Enterococcus hulanensis]MDT2627831.1 phosphate propanoyltransferase [Enterococcus hulanensis]MDT2654936.1 phosphate propanoyltransferase [Enterococcus hulanensis]